MEERPMRRLGRCNCMASFRGQHPRSPYNKCRRGWFPACPTLMFGPKNETCHQRVGQGETSEYWPCTAVLVFLSSWQLPDQLNISSGMGLINLNRRVWENTLTSSGQPSAPYRARTL